MKRMIPLLILIAILLCSCSPASVQDKDETETPTASSAIESEQSFSSDASMEAPVSDETDLSSHVPDAESDHQFEEDKEKLIQALMKAHPNFTEAEIREGVEEIYGQITKGEMVSLGSFTYQEPMYYLKEIIEYKRTQSVVYTSLMTDGEFELQLSEKTLLFPTMLSAVENADKSELIKLDPDAAQWEVVFYHSGGWKGMEIISDMDVFFVSVDDTNCISIENISIDSPILQDIRDVFLSMY